MVYVRIMHARDDFEQQFVGDIYEAFPMFNPDNSVYYTAQVQSNLLWSFERNQCLVVQEDEKKSTDEIDKILMVEDGSVDIDALEEWCDGKGIYVLVYRQGSTKPEFLNLK